jgi:hypothetical protein
MCGSGNIGTANDDQTSCGRHNPADYALIRFRPGSFGVARMSLRHLSESHIDVLSRGFNAAAGERH